MPAYARVTACASTQAACIGFSERPRACYSTPDIPPSTLTHVPVT